MAVPVDVPGIEALTRKVARPHEGIRELDPQSRLELLRPTAICHEERIDHRPKSSVAERVGDDHRALATGVQLRDAAADGCDDVRRDRASEQAPQNPEQPIVAPAARESATRERTAILQSAGNPEGLERGYSPITLQMKPIEMKKPENRAISPMPP